MPAMRILLLATLLAVSAPPVFAQSPAAEPQAIVPTRVTPLFNGRDLAGWTADVPEKDKNPDAPASFIVRDGKLVSLGVPRGHLLTDAVYRNYRLEVEYRFPGKPGNCGVLVHASRLRALSRMFPQSIEVQMMHENAGDFWCIEENIEVPDMETRRPRKEGQNYGGSQGDARRILNLTDGSEKPLGEWNTMVIEARDRTVKVRVNGDLVNEGFNSTADRGKIALQAEGAEVEFRKIEIGPLPEPKRAANGLAYDRAGSGPAVVFIHGAFLDRRLWNREFEALKPRATVIRYDQRGHGESTLPTEPFSHVDDLVRLLDELKIERATLVGLSSGAQIAVDAALTAPKRVERLVLVAGGFSGYVPKETPPFAADLMAAMKAGDFPKAIEVMLGSSIYFAPPGSRGLVRSMVSGNEKLFKFDPRIVRRPEVPAIKRLGQIKAPTLILVGDEDTASIRDQADILAARVPGARLVPIKGGNHLLNLTSPEEFGRHLQAFLN